MLKDIRHWKPFLNCTTSFIKRDIDLQGKSTLYNEPTITLYCCLNLPKELPKTILDSTYTVIRLLNKSLASWTYKQNLNALDLEESLFKLFYCGINELIQGRKRSQNRMANWSYQLVSRNNLLIIQNSSSTTPPSKRKTTLQGTIIKF